jgi:uncharacterized Ntn-hydrolase superfamily protein
MNPGIRRLCLAAVLCLLVQPAAFATWSVVAVDRSTGQIVVASATCLQQAVFVQLGVKDLRDIQAVVVPGKGAAVCQASMDSTRRNQQLVLAELEKGTEPTKILDLLRGQDSAFQSRQFGILDLQGRSVGFSGTGNLPSALAISGTVGNNISYQIQGNILAGDAVVHDAARALSDARGTLADRVMAAMEAGDAAGGDRRCTGGKTAYVAYLLIVEKDGKSVYFSATDADTTPTESPNPVKTLRLRYDAR